MEEHQGVILSQSAAFQHWRLTTLTLRIKFWMFNSCDEHDKVRFPW